MAEVQARTDARCSGRARAGDEPELQLEQHRRELTGYCYRMLGSAFEAEDAVQETMRARLALPRSLRGPRGAEVVALPHRDQRLPRHDRRQAAPRPSDGPQRAGHGRRPARDAPGDDVARADARRPGRCREAADPAELAQARETLRLAFVNALQHLPARQRAVLILREVLHWRAAEVAELLDTSVASVNSALQRARAALDASDARRGRPAPAARRRPARGCSTATSRRSSSTTSTRWCRCCTRTRRCRCRPTSCGCGPRRHRPLAHRHRLGVPRLAPAAGDGQRLAGLRPVPAERARRQLRAVGAAGHRALTGGRITGINSFLDTARLFPLFGLPDRPGA